VENSKVMVVGREGVVLQVEVEMNDEIMELVSPLNYLGVCFREDGDPPEDEKLECVKD